MPVPPHIDLPYPDVHVDIAAVFSEPKIDPTAWIAPNAIVNGRVSIGPRASIWSTTAPSIARGIVKSKTGWRPVHALLRWDELPARFEFKAADDAPVNAARAARASDASRTCAPGIVRSSTIKNSK